MKSHRGPEGRIKAVERAHPDARRSRPDRIRAAKRVANVSLPRGSRAFEWPPLDRCYASACCVRDLLRPARTHCSLTISRLLIAPDPSPHLGEQHAAGRRARSEGITSMNENNPPATTGNPTTATDPLLTPEDVSQMLGGVPAATLKRWRTQRTGPVALHIGRHVRYRRSAVEAWLDAKDREAAAWMAS